MSEPPARLPKPALRFLLEGFGAATLVGIGVGLVSGPVAGALVVWLGGSTFSLLLACNWYRTQQELHPEEITGATATELAEIYAAWDCDLDAERLAADPRGEMPDAETGPVPAQPPVRRRA